MTVGPSSTLPRSLSSPAMHTTPLLRRGPSPPTSTVASDSWPLLLPCPFSVPEASSAPTPPSANVGPPGPGCILPSGGGGVLATQGAAGGLGGVGVAQGAAVVRMDSGCGFGDHQAHLPETSSCLEIHVVFLSSGMWPCVSRCWGRPSRSKAETDVDELPSAQRGLPPSGEGEGSPPCRASAAGPQGACMPVAQETPVFGRQDSCPAS